MNLRRLALVILALGCASALPLRAAETTAPLYRNKSNTPLSATAVYCVDLLGNYVGCGGSGSGGPSPGSSSANPAYTTPVPVTRTRTVCTLPAYASGGNAVCTDATGQQTTTTCAANTACQILPGNANRRTFFIMNRTTGVTVDVGYSASVAPGTGIGIDGASIAGGQGAGFTENPAHAGTYFATAPAAATVVVVQGQ